MSAWSHQARINFSPPWSNLLRNQVKRNKSHSKRRQKFIKSLFVTSKSLAWMYVRHLLGDVLLSKSYAAGVEWVWLLLIWIICIVWWSYGSCCVSHTVSLKIHIIHITKLLVEKNAIPCIQDYNLKSVLYVANEFLIVCSFFLVAIVLVCLFCS